MEQREFIIYAPGFNDRVGGIIALHLLCHQLNKLHYKAALWPRDKSSPAEPDRLEFDPQSSWLYSEPVVKLSLGSV